MRQLIKHLLVKGNPADSEFEKRAHELLSESHYKKYLDWYVAFINRFTQAIPVLKQIAAIAPDSPKKAQIPKIREEDWVCLTATGMNVLGIIGHEMFTNCVEDWEHFTDKLGELDWKKDADIWQGNIIQNGRVITQTSPVRKAAEAVMVVIGLKKAPSEEQSPLPLETQDEITAQGAQQ